MDMPPSSYDDYDYSCYPPPPPYYPPYNDQYYGGGDHDNDDSDDGDEGRDDDDDHGDDSGDEDGDDSGNDGDGDNSGDDNDGDNSGDDDGDGNCDDDDESKEDSSLFLHSPMDMPPSSYGYDDYDYSCYPPPPPYYPPYNDQYYRGYDSDDSDDGDEGRDDDDDHGDDSGDDNDGDNSGDDDGDGNCDDDDDSKEDSSLFLHSPMDMPPSSYDDYDYSCYPPPPPYYPPYNDQYYRGGGYDSDDSDDGDEGRDDDDDDGDDSGDDDGDSGNDNDGDDSGNDDHGDNSGDNDGDDSGDDDRDGNCDDDDDRKEDSSEEYNDGNYTDEYGHDDEDPDSGGTTNIGVIHGEDTILAVDYRATKNGVYKRDGKMKMIQLTESIVLTRVGRVGVSTAIWEHLKEKLRKTSRYLTIEELANSGKEFADTITNDASGKCFIGRIEGGGSRSGKGFQHKIETFDTMGSGMVYARKAYEEGMARRGSGVSIDNVKEEVAFALLKAALEDGSTGGKLHVAQVSPTVGYQVTSRNPIESYVRFFNRLGATNEKAVLTVYQANQVSKEGVSNICSDYGTVAFGGHPLAKLRGNYYIQRVVFQEESSVTKLIQKAEVDSERTRVRFSKERRLKYLSRQIGYKIYVARCSVTFLRNLIVLDE